MDTFLTFYTLDENIFPVDFLTRYPHYCALGVLVCLLLSYSVYCKVLRRFLEKTKIPKLYKITTHHSLWMGSIHLMISMLCFSQLSLLVHPIIAAESSQPFFLNEILYAATANFCQQNMQHNDSDSNLLESSLEATLEWTSFNSISTIVIYAVLIQEILLATRNKMDHIFYSRLSGLVFVASAVRTRCPILSIQGTFLMSINSSSKEIARALVAWKAYSQEDIDNRPSPVIKVFTFVVFVIHMVIWFSLMLFYMPYFIHRLPSVTESNPNRLFLAYAYLSFLAYIIFEVATSPLWTTIQCMAWCRRSSGVFWRILALSDCLLLDHYGPLFMKLYNIQVVIDKRKALLVRNTMAQKHAAVLRGEGVIKPFPSASLPATVKTMLTMKKKMRRRIPAHSVTLKDSPQVLLKAEDSNTETDLLDKEVEVTLIDSRQDTDSWNPEEENRGVFEEDSTIEKDEIQSIGSVIKATFAKEGDESLTDADGRGSADVIQE